MPVDPFVEPDSSVQPAAAYPAIVDGAISATARIGANFAPHAQNAPSMTVAVSAGHVMDGPVLVERPGQTTGTIVAPASNPRIDRVVVDNLTGAISVVTGAESASPVAPAIPAGTSPIARVSLQSATTAITNSLIVDERDFSNLGVSSGALVGVQVFTSSGTYSPTLGTKRVVVEVQGGGGSGGSCAATGATTGSAASGGGSGAYAKAQFTASFAGVSVTVGSGGSAPSAGANDGNPGGASSFGALVIAGGGGNGRAGHAFTPPVTVGAAAPAGMPTGANIVGGTGVRGGSSYMLSIGSLHGGFGAPSHFGGGGEPGGNAAGGAALTPGSGGGGASSIASGPARAGGAGANGVVIIHEYA
jgi:hypothetical protein